MKTLISLLLGYLIGALNPAALFAKVKHVDMRKTGTHNLGASNALIVLGRGYGLIVMVLDIAKAFLAAKAAKWLFPKLAVAGMAAALGAILGHIYPFYMHFRGGKGLAAFGGMVCFYNPWLLVFYLVFGVVLMIAANYSWVLPMYAAATFPMIVYLQTGNVGLTAFSAAGAILIACTHWGNIAKAFRGEDKKIRDVIRTKVLKK